MGDFDIIKETTGKASDYAQYVVELYQKRNGKTEQVEDALNRLEKDAAWLKGNKNSHKILLCSKTDPYPKDCEFDSITGEAIRILDENKLKYVIFTENAMRAISDFEQLKRPENLKLIIKIEFIPRERKSISKPYKNNMDLIFTPLDAAFKKGTKIWIDLNQAIYPRLSLEFIHKFYPIVNQWNVGKYRFKPKTESKSTWEKFKGDAKEFFETLEILSPWTVGDIPIRKGNCNILVIAPHGYKADDENTGEIAWQIADILDCYAVVNEVYQKPPYKKINGKRIKNKITGRFERYKTNKKKKWVNLNNLDAVNEQLDAEEFLGPIKELKDEIVKRFEEAQIFLIHGIEDVHILDESKLINADPELGVLIGIGRGNPNEKPPYDERLSADPSTISNLIDLLRDKIIAEEALPRRKCRSYAGWDRRNLNQLFTARNNDDQNVQSVQIEIKMTGYRYDTQVPWTAGTFADAFEKMDNFIAIEEPSFWPALAKKCEVKEIPIGGIDLSDSKFKSRIEDYGINQEKFNELLRSIKTNQILNNIIVTKAGNEEKCQLISGFRRLAALKKVCEERGQDFSKEKVWARVFTELSDEEAYNISFSENLAREDLSLWEIANSCKAISDDLNKARKSKSDIEKDLVKLTRKGARTVRRYLRVSTIQNEEIRREIHNGNLDITTADLFAKKEFDEEDRAALHQFYKKHPMSSREFEQFTRNLFALKGWTGLKTEKILSIPGAATFLNIKPDQLKNNVKFLNKQTGKPVDHILEHNIGFLKNSLSSIEAKFAKKPFLEKFSKRSKALESKIGKVFDTQKVGANVSIKPAGDVENEMVKVTISAPASNIQKAIKLMDKEIGGDFINLKDLWENPPKGKGAEKEKVNKKFKGLEKAKTITDDGVKTETIGMPISSENRVKKYNRNRHYELISALQKSIRWCEVNESRYFARELMDMGLPGSVFNRLILIAAEDVGLADPSLIVYERGCLDRFDNLIKPYKNLMKKRDAVKFPPLCNIVDRAVIAAAISYKSRLLPQLCFATLFDIYENEDFSKNLSEYLDRFVLALKMGDEKQATYDAYVVSIFLNSEDKILEIVQKHSGMRNKDLIQKWVEEYKRNNELLMLAGSVALLCRDLQNPHGEYKDAICQHLYSPIEEAEIPDRAYDMHTRVGKKRGRGFDYFFDEAATVKNEGFLNNWEEAGRNAYIRANQEKLGKAVKIIEAIKKKL